MVTFLSELYHHGIKGQKWGVRRFQNTDGSLTSKGRARYDLGDTKRGIVNTSQNARVNKELAKRSKGSFSDPDRPTVKAVSNKEQKRQAMQQKASQYAKSEAERAKRNAAEFGKDADNYVKQYAGKKGFDKYLDDVYGSHDRNYVADYLGVKNDASFEKGIRKLMAEDISAAISYNRQMQQQYERSAKAWLDKSNRYMNTPLSELSKAERKEIKRYGK